MSARKKQMTTPFVHLHLHTEYSIVDGTVRIPALMEQCAAHGMPAVALTDQSNLFGLVKFYRKALEHGIKPLVGVDLRVQSDDEPGRSTALVLLCQNQAGYRNLTRLVTRTYLEGQYRGMPMARRDWMNADSCGGLIALSGGLHGDIGRALFHGHGDDARSLLDGWLDVFGDRY